MNEDAIASQLKGNVPTPSEPTPPPVDPVNTDEPSSSPANPQLDDMTQYKLHEFFGQEFRSADDTSKQKASYIYQTVAQMIDTSDFGYVVAKISELQRIIGITGDDRLNKTYQWLKLDNVRRSISAEMDSIAA